MLASYTQEYFSEVVIGQDAQTNLHGLGSRSCYWEEPLCDLKLSPAKEPRIFLQWNFLGELSYT